MTPVISIHVSCYVSACPASNGMKVIHLLLSLTVPLLFTSKKNEVTFFYEVNCWDHTEIFNYLSKVESFLVLNPTINLPEAQRRILNVEQKHPIGTKFQLKKINVSPCRKIYKPISYRIEVIDGDEEEFTVAYEECLSHFPGVTNSGTAHYKVFRRDGAHEMQSIHSTCFAWEFFCLSTTAVLRIIANESSTNYEEFIAYNCPWIMSSFCLNEIFFQRMAIMNALEMFFGTGEL